MEQERKRFVIIKRIAKHGKQAIIVVPKLLEHNLRPGMVAQVTVEVLEVGR